MEIMREAISVSIALLAWPFFKKGNWLLWYGAAFLANLFHFSASILFFLPIICLPYVKKLFTLGRQTIWVWLLVVIIGLVIHTAFFRYIQILNFSETINERAQDYSRNLLGSSYFSIIGILTYLIPYVLYPIVAIYMLHRRQIKEGENKFDKLTALVLASTYITILTFYVPILNRFNNYLIPFSLLIISNWVFSIVKVKGKNIKLGFVYWFLIFLPMFVIITRDKYLTYASKRDSVRLYSLYYPYKSIFDKEKDEARERGIRQLRRKF